MSNPILVTGANGFIGARLSTMLATKKQNVRCLVRRPDGNEALVRAGCEIVFGDILDPAAVAEAVKDVKTVFHLAGRTRKNRNGEMMQVNRDGTKNLLEVCARQPAPPTFVYASSLAAMGPANQGRPVNEDDPLRPVSLYGASKKGAEDVCAEFADLIPISIIRPPIVFGGGDHNGFQLFDMISRFGIQFVPRIGRDYSFIHANDLANAMELIADRGERMRPNDSASGRYLVAAERDMTLAEFGIMIGQSLGKKNVRTFYSRNFAVKMVGLANELRQKITGKSQYLNWDKAMEATSGSWACSGEKLRKQTGFLPRQTLETRVNQTTQWYFDHGWLRSTSPQTRPEVSERSHGQA